MELLNSQSNRSYSLVCWTAKRFLLACGGEGLGALRPGLSVGSSFVSLDSRSLPSVQRDLCGVPSCCSRPISEDVTPGAASRVTEFVAWTFGSHQTPLTTLPGLGGPRRGGKEAARARILLPSASASSPVSCAFH